MTKIELIISEVLLVIALCIILYFKYKQYSNPKEEAKNTFDVALEAMNEKQLLCLYETSKDKQKEVVLKHLIRIDVKYKEKLNNERREQTNI